jgi:TFIIF-interacting CTD phosphatase-like protein
VDHKDLDILERPGTDLIHVDGNSQTVQFHANNTLLIPKWTKTPWDPQLIDWLPPILEACLRVCDGRTVIKRIPKKRRAESECARIS